MNRGLASGWERVVVPSCRPARGQTGQSLDTCLWPRGLPGDAGAGDGAWDPGNHVAQSCPSSLDVASGALA